MKILLDIEKSEQVLDIEKSEQSKRCVFNVPIC